MRRWLWVAILVCAGLIGCQVHGTPSPTAGYAAEQGTLTWTLIATQAGTRFPRETLPAPETVSPLAPETATSLPTSTPQPTRTATLSPSWTPSSTPSATWTPFPSPTPTDTATALPVVVASYPIHGDRAVPLDARFSVVLADAVNPTQVNVTFAFSPTVVGKVEWINASRTSFVPQALITSTWYVMTFTIGIQGQAIAQNSVFTASFETGTKGAPIPILMYHHLRDLPEDASQGQRDWTVAPGNFRQQLDYLAQKGYHSISFGDLVAYFREHEPLPPHPMIISMDDGYREVYDVAWPLLSEKGFHASLFVLPGHVGFPAYLDWEQMAVLRTCGFEFGSHTLTHPDVRKLTPADARHEICDSKTLIEEKIRQPVVAFSYPLGAYNEETIALLKECEYQAACTLASGYMQRPWDDGLYRLKRVRVDYDTNLEEFTSRLPW